MRKSIFQRTGGKALQGRKELGFFFLKIYLFMRERACTGLREIENLKQTPH